MKSILLILGVILPMVGCATTPSKPPVPPAPVLLDLTIVLTDDTGRLSEGTVNVDGTDFTINEHGWMGTQVARGDHQIAITAPNHEGWIQTLDVQRHLRREVVLVRTVQPTTRLTTQGKLFMQGGQPWRWKGVTCFPCVNRFERGGNIQPFLDAFKGYNLLRVFLWVPVEDWHDTAWGIPSDDGLHRFLDYVGQRGWYVELTLITYATPVTNAQRMVDHYFTEFERHTNLLIELVNEPSVGRKLDARQIHVPATSVLWTTGGTIDGSPVDPASGERYGVAHTPRDGEWPRKAHDLMEYYNGGGPEAPSDPAHHYPWVADEPIRPDQAGFNEGDYEAYFGASALLSGGATFHFSSGKFMQLPTADEARCAAAALRGLDFFPPDAPLGNYSRVDDQSLRTYKVGPYTVRIRPASGAILLK